MSTIVEKSSRDDNSSLTEQINLMLDDLELNFCQKLPLQDNPYWYGIKKRLLTEEMILLGDLENAIRAKVGQPFRIHMLEMARAQGNKELYELVWEVVEDEVFSKPDHLELRMQMLRRKGLDDSKLQINVKPFTRIAINAYKDLAYNSTSAVTPMIGAGMVEKYYAYMCMDIYNAYRQNYNFTHDDVKTYYIHATVDLKHAENAIKIAKKFIYSKDLLEDARNGIILAWIATHFLYLGMCQAAMDEKETPSQLKSYLRDFQLKLFEVSSQLRIRAL